MHDLTPHTVVDPRRLRLPLPEEVAVDEEEYALGIHCLAAPVVERRTRRRGRRGRVAGRPEPIGRCAPPRRRTGVPRARRAVRRPSARSSPCETRDLVEGRRPVDDGRVGDLVGELPGWAVEALADVYDPCCREKGISVVDMGLLRSVTLSGSHARVELMLTSGWCPFATRLLTEIEDALARPTGRRHLRGRSHLGRGVDHRSPLRLSRAEAAVPPRSRLRARPRRLSSPPTARRSRRSPDDRRCVRVRRGRAPLQLHGQERLRQRGRDVQQPPLRVPPGADPGHRAEALGRAVPQGLDARRHPRNGLRALRHRHARRDAVAAHGPLP